MNSKEETNPEITNTENENSIEKEKATNYNNEERENNKLDER